MTNFYYVTVIHGTKAGRILGPYSDHETALANVERGRKLAYDADPKAWFYAFGTCKVTAKEPLGSVFGV